MLVLRMLRLPICFRRFRNIVTTCVPICWFVGLLYCLISIVINQNQLNLPRLHLEGIYQVQDNGMQLALLGFVPDPVLYPHSHHVGQDLPVFVMTLSSDDFLSFHRFLGNFRVYFPQKKLVVYNLGLTEDEIELISHTCQCLVRSVHWEHYPDHIRELSNNAYLPLLIQETLQEFGVVFWCHHTMRFNTSDLATLQSQAEGLGLVSWPVQDYPTSTFTHYSTFRYLGADHTQYHFHRMVEPDVALYCNTYRLHFKLMMPWVICALDPNCISPPGSRANGCDMSRRPRYKYAGCHRYDTSVFNVILGQMFFFDDTYIPSQQIFYFEKLTSNNSKSYISKFQSKNQWTIENYNYDKHHKQRTKRTVSSGNR